MKAVINSRCSSHAQHEESREIIKILEADGWCLVATIESHRQYKRPTKKSRTTVKHPDKDIPIKTLKRIERQSGLIFK